MKLSIVGLLVLVVSMLFGVMVLADAMPPEAAPVEPMVGMIAQTFYALAQMSTGGYGEKAIAAAMVLASMVGVASVLVEALDRIAKITPNTKDDEYAGMLKKAFGWVSAILSYIARNESSRKK